MAVSQLTFVKNVVVTKQWKSSAISRSVFQAAEEMSRQSAVSVKRNLCNPTLGSQNELRIIRVRANVAVPAGRFLARLSP